MTIEPLRRRIMTVEVLRKKTLRMLKACRKQLLKCPHEVGLTDQEFFDRISDFETDIRTDIAMEKLL